MAHCKRFSAILVNEENQSLGLLTRARCKQWDCAYCARQNKLAWRAVIYVYLMENPDIAWSFHTFTFHFAKKAGKRARLIYSIRQIKNCWDTLMKRLKRRYGSFQYVRILEPHELGGYHIHMLAGFVIPDDDIAYRTQKYANDSGGFDERKIPYLKWLSEDIVSLGFGYIQHSENAIGNGAQTVSYVTKYMTKDSERQYDRLKDNKIRYVQTSRGIKSPFNQPSTGEWKMKPALTYKDFIEIEEWKDLNLKKTVTIDDIQDHNGFYPQPDVKEVKKRKK